MGKIKNGTMKKRQVVVIVLISSLVMILGGVAWWYFTQYKPAIEHSTQAVVEMSDIDAVTAEGRRAIQNQDIKNGEARYDAALESTQDDNVTLQLLLAKVNFYTEAKEFDKAIATAKEADKQFPGKMAVYAALAHAYELKGAKQEAIAEYRRALEILGDSAPSDASKPAASRANPAEYYQARIQELEK